MAVSFSVTIIGRHEFRSPAVMCAPVISTLPVSVSLISVVAASHSVILPVAIALTVPGFVRATSLIRSALCDELQVVLPRHPACACVHRRACFLSL